MMKIYAKHGSKAYLLTVSQDWARKNDNGALASCGLTVPDDISLGQLNRLISLGKAQEVSVERFNHAGCLSSCQLRGDSICRW